MSSLEEEYKMTTAVSTRLYKINIKTILKNYLNREFWEKQWTVYEYDGLTIKISIREIYVRDNAVVLRVTRNGALWGSTFSVNIDNHNEIVFTKSLMSAIKEQIRQHEYDSIVASAGYGQALQWDESTDENNTLKAEMMLDAENVTNKDVRDAFVDRYVSDNRSSHASEYRNYYDMRTLPHLYLMLAYLYETQNKESSNALITAVGERAGGKSMELYAEEIKQTLQAMEVVDSENEND
jgi:hypothetical protein